jgi:hypothetical protein
VFFRGLGCGLSPFLGVLPGLYDFNTPSLSLYDTRSVRGYSVHPLSPVIFHRGQ